MQADHAEVAFLEAAEQLVATVGKAGQPQPWAAASLTGWRSSWTGQLRLASFCLVDAKLRLVEDDFCSAQGSIRKRTWWRASGAASRVEHGACHRDGRLADAQVVLGEAAVEG
jgi:hypothetical protein